MGIAYPGRELNYEAIRRDSTEAYLITQKDHISPEDQEILDRWRESLSPVVLLRLVEAAQRPLIPYTPEQMQVVAQIEQYAERILSTQDILYGSVAMYNAPEGKHSIPPLHVAAVLHGLADFTHNKHIVDTIIDQQALARDERGQGFEPRVTSLGRYFHRLADSIEWREMDKWQK